MDFLEKPTSNPIKNASNLKMTQLTKKKKKIFTSYLPIAIS